MSMKYICMIFVLTAAMIVSGCNANGSPGSNLDASTPAVSDTDSVEMSQLPTEEPKHYWDSDNQFDPTLPENRDRFWAWHHTEYKAFGDPSSFQTNRLTVVSDDGEHSMELGIKLPQSYSVDENGIINFDGGFAEGTFEAGYIQGFYELQPDETLFENALRYKLFEEYLQPANERASDEFEIGAYHDIGGIIRFVDGAPSENYQIAYLVPLEDKHITMLVFYVDVNMEKHYMTIFDDIALSIEL